MDVRGTDASKVEPFISEDMILAAKKGAAWLDEKYPAWEKLIVLDFLNLRDPFYCVLGQVGGTTYGYALQRFGLEHETEAVELGFTLAPNVDDLSEHNPWAYPTSDEMWRELTNAWKHLIEERRGEDPS